MALIDQVLNKLPQETRETAELIWQSLPPSERKTLLSWVSSMPTETAMLRTLLTLSANHLKQTFGQKHHVAIIGPANVGKSTLYNQMVNPKAEKARVSPLPGTTRENQAGDSGLFTIVDTPGADQAGTLGQEEQETAFRAARSADFLIIMFDAIQGIKEADINLFNEITALGKPYITVLNKVDLVRKNADFAHASAAEALGVSPDQLISISAKTGDKLSEIVTAIAVTEPELVAALGQTFPEYRSRLAYRTIVNAASISAVIALTPLPVIDFAPLLITQTTLVLGIARIYNYQINLKRARELLVTFGIGFLGRQLFYELSKFGGIPGWMLSSAIAASTTVAMGYASIVWFERGEKLSQQQMKEISKSITQKLLEAIKSIGKKKSNPKKLKKIIEDTLSSGDMIELKNTEPGNLPQAPIDNTTYYE